MLFFSSLLVPFSFEADDAVYIRVDGSIDPLTSPILTVDNVTYTLNDNIFSPVVIERDNIVLDGAGFSLRGTNGSGTIGLYLAGRVNVTVKNAEIRFFDYGVRLFSSGNCCLMENDVAENNWGIYLHGSSNENNVTANEIAQNRKKGVCLGSSSNNIVSGNLITENYWDAINLHSGSNDNTVTGNTIVNNTNSVGVVIDYYSEYNTLALNNISSNHAGVWIVWGYHNRILENTIADNKGDGISIQTCSDNDFCANQIVGNERGFYFHGSSNNSIRENNITGSFGFAGISLYSSSDRNVIVANNITSNSQNGLWISSSSNNSIHHNNFIDNAVQACIDGSANFWDDGYPSGGNYWSDYADVDSCKGSYQNETGSDGIWDHPYTINVSNQDSYPIVPEFPTFLLLPLFAASTLIVTARRKRN